MNVYSVEVKICATAYIRADSPEAAAALARAAFDRTDASVPAASTYFGDVSVSESQYEDIASDAEHAPVSLSPALTFDACTVTASDADCVHEGDGETWESIRADALRPGDRVDLEGRVEDASAEFEWATCIGSELEEASCVRLDFEGFSSLGCYPQELLRVRRRELYPDAAGWATEEAAQRKETAE